jgi:hypothetical protein
MKQDIAEGKNQACLKMTEDLVSYRRCLSNHKESAEVY